ncbi:HEAT repeat domain-containing protein [Thermoflexus hugenholtzii]
MSPRPSDHPEIERYLQHLGSSDPGRARTSREALIALGAPALEALVAALEEKEDSLRWEAVKTLRDMGDPRAAPAFIRLLLEDPNPGIRWLAAEGLLRLDVDGLRAVLQALVHHSDSPWLREGTRHVLKALAARGHATELLPVLEAMDGLEPALTVPPAAQRALDSLFGHGSTA